jgi:ABC-2 type transport system ATP-binding protein
MIVAEGITKYYGARRALDDVSFEIAQGEVVGFLGLNGAGKTTVLKILSGLLLPSAGRVTVDGVEGRDAPLSLRRRIGFLPDRPPLYVDMSVRQHLRYAARLFGVPKADVEARVGAALEGTQLTDVADDLVAWLSHGYRQRVGIAQAIVHDPALVILDEPISGLDPKQIAGMRTLIRSLAERHTVLLSSHILQEISQTCDRILVLQHGKIVAQGTEAELRARHERGRVEIVARGSLDLAEAAVDSVDGAEDLELVSASEALVTFTARVEGDDAREALVGALVAHGLGVRTVREAGSSDLESIFLALTDAPREAA